MVAEAVSTTMTNSDFLAELYGNLQPGQYGWVTNFRVDPGSATADVWAGRMYKGTPAQAALIDRAEKDNAYFCTAVLQPNADGEFVRRKDAFVRLAALVVDDITPADIQTFTWLLQTSPGKYQCGILLDCDDPDTYNRQLIDRVMSALAARGRSNDASGNACVRYVRLPVGSNTKPRAAGVWSVKLETWAPNVRWSLEDACAAVGIDLDALRVVAAVDKVAPTNVAGTGMHAGEFIAGITGPIDQRAYHDSITRLAASLISGGMFPGAAVELLYSLMDQAKPHGDVEELRRWEQRRAEIPRAVKSAEEKFTPEQRKPPQVTVNLQLSDKSDDESDKTSGDLQPMDWSALQGTQPEPTQWRLEGWLPERVVTLLAANGGVGKSNLSLQLGVSLVTGREFMGLKTKRSRVLVISGEDEARTVHFRTANVCADMGVALSDLQGQLIVYDLTQADCVLWRDGNPTQRMQWLADTVVRAKADVVVIDNASDVFADNENDRTAVRGFMRCLTTICSLTGCAVLLLSHVDKASVRVGAGMDSNSTFSGSTAWNNSARSRWAMVRSEQAVLLRHEKCNLGPLQEEIRLEFDPGAKVFKHWGGVPGNEAARRLLRNTHRLAILRLVGAANDRGERLSMSAQANNNAFVKLREEPEFPQLLRKDFFQMLTELKRDGLLHEVDYVVSRNKHKGLELTDIGRLRVTSGSSAPAMWRGGDDDETEG